MTINLLASQITNKKRKLEEDMDELVAKADKTANADPDSISLTSRGLGTSLQVGDVNVVSIHRYNSVMALTLPQRLKILRRRWRMLRIVHQQCPWRRHQASSLKKR